MRTAIVHDWFVKPGGAEKVIAKILELFPDADVFSTVDYLSPQDREIILQGKKVTTTFIQNLPKSKAYKKYFPLMPLAIESLDFSNYDLIISSSSSIAKGVITGPDQIHLCYCHSPMRYAWDMQEQYLKESNLHSGFKSFIVRNLLFFMRNWDVRSSFGVDYFIANSEYVAKRIKKVYRRDSEVIYPNVEVEDYECVTKKQDYYVTCSRLVPYKKVDLIIKAFSELPEKKLVVIGDGSEMHRIAYLAKGKANINILGHQDFSVLKEKISNAKAFVFAAEEDFGIAPLEAQACGTPVIAYGKGGAIETVIEAETGVFFNEQTPSSLIDAIIRFESMNFDHKKISLHAKKFSTYEFKKNLQEFVDKILK